MWLWQIFEINEYIIKVIQIGGVKMKIYADILVLENFIVNFFLLTLTMKCIKHKSKTNMLVISSFIGGVYTLVLILPKLNILASLPFQLIVAFIMINL